MGFIFKTLAVCALAGSPAAVSGFDYMMTGAGGVSLVDVASEIGSLKTLFTGEDVMVTVDGVEWEAYGAADTTRDANMMGTYKTMVGDKELATGTFTLMSGKTLTASFSAGTVKASESGAQTITVELTLDGVTVSASNTYQTYGAGTSLLPLFVVLLLAMTTSNVELSLGFAIFFGACMVTGDIELGIKKMLDGYILDSVSK